MKNKTENNWSIFYQKYIKFFLDIIKKHPKATTLLAVYIIAVGNILGNLNFIGRVDLFPLAINLTGLFQIIIPSFVVIIISIMLIFLIQSFWTIFAITKWIPKSLFKKIPRFIILLPIFTAFIWLTLALVIEVNTFNLFLIYCLPIIFSSIIYIITCKKHITKHIKIGTCKTIIPHLKLYGILLFSAVLACFPLSLILSFIDDSEIDSAMEILGLLFYLFFFLLCIYLPSLACLPSKSKKALPSLEKLKSNIINILTATFTSLALLFLILPINLFTLISVMSLQVIGITDTQPHTYLIQNKNYVKSDFPISTWHSQKGINAENRIFIKGVNAISLGDTKLICPISFIQLRKNALKYKLTHLLNKNKSENLIKFQQENRKCITFNKDEILQWDSID